MSISRSGGGRVVEVTRDDIDVPILRLTHGKLNNTICVDLGSDVTVERVAPPEWPPRPGELWEDAAGRLWFAFDGADYDDGESMEVVMQSTCQHSFGKQLPDEFNQRFGPVRRLRAASQVESESLAR